MSSDRRNIRVLPELRSAQIRDYIEGPPARVLYLGVNYDLRSTVVPDEFERVSLLKAAIKVLRSDGDILETPEPLWIRFLPKNVVLVLAWRIGGIFRRKNRRARTFAIENNDLSCVLFGRRSAPAVVYAAARKILDLFVRFGYERIAFGSDGAARTYSALKAIENIETRTFEHLPSPLTDGPVDTELADRNTAVFVGRLEARKGIELLRDAWVRVEARLHSAELVIVGDGPLEGTTKEWCEESSNRTFMGGLEHAAVQEVIASSAVLAAPSLRDGRWREQVGLPIVEALARGLTIVTTNETGLAAWLMEHGHFVVTTASAEDLSRALEAALRLPIPRAEVLASLPSTRGRLAAARWLYQSDPFTAEQETT
jgi:glycosyltransferase involved in cell wall biosynthesis